MRPQHDNDDTSCTSDSKVPLRRDPLTAAADAVGNTTLDSKTSSLLSNRLNFYSPVVTLQRSGGFSSFISPTEIIGDLESTGNANKNDNIGCQKENSDCIKGNSERISRQHQFQTSLACLRSRLNENEQVMCEGYEDELESRLGPIGQDVTTTTDNDDLPRNSFSDSAEWMEEDGKMKCCWMIDLFPPGEVAASEGMPSSESSPVNSILVLSSAISSRIPSPDISQDLLSCQSSDDLNFSAAAASSTYDDFSSRSEHHSGTPTDFDAGRKEYKIKIDLSENSKNGSWSSSPSGGSSLSFDHVLREGVREPVVDKFTTPSSAAFSWHQVPSSESGRVTWLCNYGCHKPIKWKYGLCETDHLGQLTERKKVEEKELVEIDSMTVSFPRNSLGQPRNEVVPSEVGLPAPLPLLARVSGIIYSKDCLRCRSSAGKDINCNLDHWTRNDLESAATRRSKGHAASTTHAPVSSCSDGGVSGMEEFGGCSSNRVAESKGRREGRSIDNVSIRLHAKVLKLQGQRCNVAEVLRRYHEERRMHQRQLIRLRTISGSGRKKELMANILRELRLLLASQVASLQRSYDQILSRQWRNIFQCIAWS